MTLHGSQRRGLRRRLLQSAGGGQPTDRSADQAAALSRPDRTTPYSKEARPENHPALGTRLPTRRLPLVGTMLAIILPIAGLITLAATLERWLPVAAGEDGGVTQAWRATSEQLRACLSMAPRTGLAAWAGQVVLVAAACVAISVRQMRRHRLDDYQGRYRSWGWIAGLAIVATIERQLPLSALASSFAADATGISLGPGGMGWWLCLSIPCCLAVGLWAVLPMHERAFTASVLAAGGVAWAGSSACSWVATDSPSALLSLASGGLTLAGDGLMLMTMLVAARSVLLEVRGEVRSRPAKAARPAGTPKDPRPQDASQPRLARDEASEDESRNDDASRESTHWSDGSEGAEDDSDDAWDAGGKKLSKSERKRLRKLSRMNRAA